MVEAFSYPCLIFNDLPSSQLLNCESRVNLPQASQLLGMTKAKSGFPLGFGCMDPRSQKRDLGHPSIVSDTDKLPTESHAYRAT